MTEQHMSPLQAAQPEMRALSDKFDAVCVALFHDRKEIVIRERVVSRSHIGWSPPRGTRLPLHPTTEGIFYAWSTSVAADAWLNLLEPIASEDLCTNIRVGMKFAREKGFQVMLHHPEEMQNSSMAWAYDVRLREPRVRMATELVTVAEYSAKLISAPVFEAGGRVAFVPGLTGLDEPIKGEVIQKVGIQLAQACHRLSALFAATE